MESLFFGQCPTEIGKSSWPEHLLISQFLRTKKTFPKVPKLNQSPGTKLYSSVLLLSFTQAQSPGLVPVECHRFVEMYIQALHWSLVIILKQGSITPQSSNSEKLLLSKGNTNSWLLAINTQYSHHLPMNNIVIFYNLREKITIKRVVGNHFLSLPTFCQTGS